MGARPIIVGTSPATGQKYFDWEVHLLSLQNIFFFVEIAYLLHNKFTQLYAQFLFGLLFSF